MSKICEYVYGKGNDVICGKTNKVLGDIMGYDGRKCRGCKYRIIYKKYITLDECCKLIPFDIFDLQINGKNLCRGCTIEYFPKLVHNIIGIKDVRISLRESLVDLIVEE